VNGPTEAGITLGFPTLREQSSQAHPTPVAHRCFAATSLYKICSSSSGSGYNRGRRHGRQEPPVDGG
jgi:hypothetical protein